MRLMHVVRKVKRMIPAPIFKLLNSKKEKFECPICGYEGPFMDVNLDSGYRKHATCPKCGSGERNRLQCLVMMDILKSLDVSSKKMLHFAPEPFFADLFQKQFGGYETADLSMKNVDYNVDLQNLPFDDATYDVVFASHVLEHVPDDEEAIREIRRILKPNGIAILPVPLVSEETIEYPEPNPNEDFHVRAPGLNYFKKYNKHFSRVVVISSDQMPRKYQLYVYEDRRIWPTKDAPLRRPMQGDKHLDAVPVCYV